MNRRMIEITPGVHAEELEFNEPELIEKYRKVCPKNMADGTIHVYVWLPPLINPVDGKPTSIERLLRFNCPVGPKGPTVQQITRLLDEKNIPKMVKKVSEIPVPPEIAAITDDSVLADLAAQMQVKFTPGTDQNVVKMLLASECQTSQHAIRVLSNMRDSLNNAARNRPEPTTAARTRETADAPA